MRVLRARGSELDKAFGFGMVRQLFERSARKSPDVLSEGAEQAAAVFTGTSTEQSFGAGLYDHLQGLYWLAADLAEQQPLMLLADDLHRADTASLRWFAFLTERIQELLLVCATRSSEPGAKQDLLDVLLDSSVDVVRAAPLSAGAVAAQVHARLPDAAEEFTVACHRATRGNAFLLCGLVSELADAGMGGPRLTRYGYWISGPDE